MQICSPNLSSRCVTVRRIHGPTMLVEYDDTQNNANHIHTVWRDLENDFGGDLLKKHYEEAHLNK